jgi:integrase
LTKFRHFSTDVCRVIPAFPSYRGETHHEQKIEELTARFIEEQELKGASPHTLRGFQQSASYWLESGLSLEHFESKDLLEMFAAALPPTLASSTMIVHLTRLCTFSNWCARNHYTNMRHRAPHQSRRPKHRLLPTAEETRRLLNALAERAALATVGRARTRQQDYLIVRVLYETGARISEALALNVDDVFCSDDERSYIIIRGTKSEAAERAVAVSDELAQDLYNFRVRWHLARGRIFKSKSRRPLSGNEFGKWLKDFCASINIHCPVTPHTFRYAYILGLIEEGKSALEVMTRLGHTDVEMTVYYFNQVRRLMPYVEVSGDIAILERKRKFWKDKGSKF